MQNEKSDGSPQGQPPVPAAFGRQANKGILVDAIGDELKIPRRTAARILDAVLDSIRGLLASRGKVAIKGFGTFERRIRKGRAYKHPLTNEVHDVPDRETIVFKPSDDFIRETRSDRRRGRVLTVVDRSVLPAQDG